jgi:hypothetical protein
MLKLLFRKKKNIKKPRTVEENMIYMASLGISPNVIMEYQETANKLKNHKV